MPDDPRLKRLFDAMRQGVQPIPETSPQINPNISMQPRINSELPGAVTPDAAPVESPRDFVPPPSQQPPMRIRLGSDRGLQGIDKSVDELKTEEQANKDYPSSKVVNGEILPPKMHHGVGDTLKSIGKGIVIGMGQRAAQGDDSTAGLLGAGAAGGAVGGISPVSIDALQGQAQIDRDRQALKGQLGIEGEQAQVEAAKARPQIEAQRVLMESEQRAETARREAERNAEIARHNKETEAERRDRPRAAKPPVTQEDEQGNKYLADPDTGEPLKDAKGNIRYATRARSGGAEFSNEQIQQNIKDAATEQAKVEQALKDTAPTISEPSPYLNQPPTEKRNPIYADLENRRDKLIDDQRRWRGELKGSTARPSDGESKPDTRKGTISKEQQQRWLTDNPGKTIKDMQILYPNAVIVN